jgi:hypothetical protein
VELLAPYLKDQATPAISISKPSLLRPVMEVSFRPNRWDPEEVGTSQSKGLLVMEVAPAA